jgi:hypothetical protein
MIAGTILGSGLVYTFIPSKSKGSDEFDPVSKFEKMSMDRVNEVLSNQKSIVPGIKSVVTRFDIGAVNSNHPIEDYHSEGYNDGKWIFGYFLQCIRRLITGYMMVIRVLNARPLCQNTCRSIF